MRDGRAKNGGKRAGAGRKSLAVEQSLAALLEKCTSNGEEEEIIRKLVEDSKSPSFRIRHESRKLLLAYKHGKPVERQEISGDLDVNMPSPEELRKKFTERRKAIEALDD